MIENNLHRLSSQRAACKQWCVLLGVAILLVGGLGKLSATTLIWAAAPLLLLGFTEAGYAAQQRREEDQLRSRKGNNEGLPLAPESAAVSATRWAVSAVSLSIWPFYLGLFSIVAVGGGAFSTTGKAGGARFVQTALAQPACSSSAGSGCGSAAGCGVGSCGASSGKGCSCGGGASTGMAASRIPPQMMPVQQQYLQTANGPMPLQYIPQRVPNGMQMPAHPPMANSGVRNIPPNAAQLGVPSTFTAPPAIKVPPAPPGPAFPITPAGPGAPTISLPPPANAIPNPVTSQPAAIAVPPVTAPPGSGAPAGGNP